MTTVRSPTFALGEWVHVVHLNSALPGWARPVTYLPVLQLMAYYRAMYNGQNPDLPANLSFVISLDTSMRIDQDFTNRWRTLSHPGSISTTPSTSSPSRNFAFAAT